MCSCIFRFETLGWNVKPKLFSVSHSDFLQRSNLALIEFTDDRFELPIEEIISSGVNLFFLTNPHAPSGLSFPKPEIAKILNNLEAILVVDEAYADFADDTSISLLSEADNLIITRTFFLSLIPWLDQELGMHFLPRKS